jgi:hypothetical protein
LLRNINPRIPPPLDESTYGERAIITTDVWGWGHPSENGEINDKIRLNTTVSIYFKKDKDLMAACEIGDLAAAIKDRKVALWSSAGIVLLVIASSLQIALLLIEKKVSKLPQTEFVIKTAIPVSIKEKPNNESTRSTISYLSVPGLAVALFVGFIIGLLKFPRERG